MRNEIIRSNHWHPGCPVPLSGMRVLTLTYWGFDHRTHTGQMVVNAHAVGPLTIEPSGATCTSTFTPSANVASVANATGLILKRGHDLARVLGVLDKGVRLAAG